MEFNKSYTQYWESAVQKSVDGTVIAGPNEADHFLSLLGLSYSDRILDLGCSTGRMFGVLSRYSNTVYGAEPDSYAVSKALAHPYQEVHQGTAQVTGYPDAFFDFVFCWAVFDVVDHINGLFEINRILKKGCHFLITCKADNYDLEDVLAFKAEKNAFLKGFPNKFTNLALLCRQIGIFGFELTDLVIFPRRGDMGLLNYKRQPIGECSQRAAIEGYEYLMVARKISSSDGLQYDFGTPLCGQFSVTAKALAIRAGYASVKRYFESIGID